MGIGDARRRSGPKAVQGYDEDLPPDLGVEIRVAVATWLIAY